MLTISFIVVSLVIVSLAVRSYLRRRAAAAQWRVVTRTLEDGTRRVVLSGPGAERVIRELPAALDGPQLEAELLEARSWAFGEALRLNRPLAGRAPAPRSRS